MKHLLSLACLLTCVACASLPGSAGRRAPGDDQRAVLDTVQAFFDVMAADDAEAGAPIVVPDGVFVNVRSVDGKRTLKHFRNQDWLDGMATETSALREAFDGNPTVLVEGDVAVVWGRYTFDVDGARSHTGIDAFDLVRTDDGWKIAGGVYSVVR